jgi:hypothetical protein
MPPWVEQLSMIDTTLANLTVWRLLLLLMLMHAQVHARNKAVDPSINW